MRPRPGTTKPYRPTRAQLRQARAQARYYRSQGRAVQRVADVQRRYGPGVATRGPSLEAARARKAAAVKTRRVRERKARTHRRRVLRAQARKQAIEQALATERYYSSFGSGGVVTAPGAPSVARPIQSPRGRAEFPDVGRFLRRVYFVGDGDGTNKRGTIGGSILPSGVVAPTIAIQHTRPEYRARTLAPALTALEQLNRPIFGVASGTKAAIRGENIPAAVGRGLTLQERTLFSDVLDELGWRPKGGAGKLARGGVGFLLDVGLDPTTYVTGGVTSVARQGAMKSGARVGEAAVRAKTRELAPKVAAGELTKKQAKAQAKTAGRSAARREFERKMRTATPGQHTPAVRVGVAGSGAAKRAGRRVRRRVLPRTVEQRVAGLGPVAPLTRATSGARRGVGAVTRRAPESVREAASGLRQTGASLHAGIRPAGVSKSEQTTLRAVRRESRAESERLIRRTAARANALLARLRKDERDLVIDAIEANDLSRLRGAALPRLIRARYRRDPDRLVKVARTVRDELRYLQRIGRRSGVLAGQVGERSRPSRGAPGFEAEMSAQAGRAVPSTTKLERALGDSEREFATARSRLRQASTPEARAAARAALLAAGRDLTRLRRRVAGVEAQTGRSAAATSERRQARRERLEGQAKGYFPRIESGERKGVLRELAEPLQSVGAVPTPIGQARPKPGVSKQREHREPRAALREGTDEQRDVAANLSPEVSGALARYGTQLGRGVGSAQLNRSLVEQLGEALPREITPRTLRELERSGRSVYRLRRGALEKLDASAIRQIRAAARGRAGVAGKAGPRTEAAGISKTGGGTYVVLRDELVERARRGTETDLNREAALRLYDRALSGFKGLALSTPGYFVRNLLGDLYNALGSESAFRLARNLVRGKAALDAIGRQERAARNLKRSLEPKQRAIRLTPAQADQIADQTSGRLYQTLRRGNPDLTRAELRDLIARRLVSAPISPLEVAQLAERMGVIRQGRFLELMEEGRKVNRPRGSNAWTDVAKRIEDSVRIATFLGGLQRGMNPRQAAQRASDVHFDYGDLTKIERQVFRRIAPFYTFPSRNLPLQAQILGRKPGLPAAVSKAQEEARKASDLPRGWRRGMSEYDLRQLGLPIRLGGDVFTVSVAAPFTDLNDLTAFAGGLRHPLRAGQTAALRIMEQAAPLGVGKVPFELALNVSSFFRDEIEREPGELTAAPEWAAALARRDKRFAQTVGFEPNYVSPDGTKTPGWRRKADFVMRQLQIGPLRLIGEIPGVGIAGADARNRGQVERLLGFVGPRVKRYDVNQNAINRLYDERDTLDARMGVLRRTEHPTERGSDGQPVLVSADHPTPEYERLLRRKGGVERRLDARQRAQRPGGFVKGERVRAESRVRVAPAPKARVGSGQTLRLGAQPTVRLGR